MLARVARIFNDQHPAYSDRWQSGQRPGRKARSVDMLRKCEVDLLVIYGVARLYWTDQRVEKAREWVD